MKVLVITKCEECNKYECPLRVPCGKIPEECPLPDDVSTYCKKHAMGNDWEKALSDD